MKFSDLPKGAKYRLHSRGLPYTKETEGDRSGTLEVIWVDEPDRGLPKAEAPTRPAPEIKFIKGGVWLEGMFDAEQLEAVLAALKKRKR